MISLLLTCWIIDDKVRTSILSALLYPYKTRWKFSKALFIFWFLIPSTNLGLKTQISEGISWRWMTGKIFFLIKLVTSFCLNAAYWMETNAKVSAKKDEWFILNMMSSSLFLNYSLSLCFSCKNSFSSLSSNFTLLLHLPVSFLSL